MANLEFFAYVQNTENPTIYVSLIQQFWNTATARTLDNGEMEITATIDGKVKIVSEASIRRHLKLEDSDGISNLPTTEIFEQLALMGTYIAPTLTQKLFSNMRRASKGYTGVDIPLFPTMLVQGPVVQGEGSTVLVESHHTPTSAPSTSQPPIDEAPSTVVDVRHGGAATTVTSLDAGHGSGNIDKTPSMPHELPFLRVHTLESDEGRMQHNELMDLVTKLSDRVVALETDLQQTKKVYGTDFTKLIKKVKKLEKTIKTRQARRKARIVVFDDEEDLEDPSKQRRKIVEIDQDPDISLVQHDAKVQGRHEHDIEPMILNSLLLKKFILLKKELVLLSQFPLLVHQLVLLVLAEIDEEERQRISRVQEEASFFIFKEWDDIQARVEVDEEFAQRLQSEEREMYFEAKKARLLAELINERKRYFAAQRSEERRNKPLT
ncbi:hypothetical protein Tco_0153265 [Tanacetum coccineum]